MLVHGQRVEDLVEVLRHLALFGTAVARLLVHVGGVAAAAQAGVGVAAVRFLGVAVQVERAEQVVGGLVRCGVIGVVGGRRIRAAALAHAARSDLHLHVALWGRGLFLSRFRCGSLLLGLLCGGRRRLFLLWSGRGGGARGLGGAHGHSGRGFAATAGGLQRCNQIALAHGGDAPQAQLLGQLFELREFHLV